MSLPAGVCVWHQVQCSRPLAPCTANRGPAHRVHAIGTVYQRTLAAAATAAAAGANSSGPVSTTAWPSAESGEAPKVLDQGPSLEAKRIKTDKKSRRRRQTASSSAKAPADVTLDKDEPQTAEQQQQHRRRKTAKQMSPTVDAALIETLISRAHLSQNAAQKIAAAKASGYGIPKETGKLCSNVHQLQQMLGAEYADLALTRFPSLVAYRWVTHNPLSATYTMGSRLAGNSPGAPAPGVHRTVRCVCSRDPRPANPGLEYILAY